MVCWSMTYIQMCGYFIHGYAAIFLPDDFNCCNGLWCHHSVCLTRSRRVCYRTNAVHELPIPLVHLLWRQTCITNWTFIRRWIWWVSPLHYLKNGWQNAVPLWWILQAGPPPLHYYCAVILHSCIVLPPVGHSSNHQYHCSQLQRKSSCVSNFYRTFKIFIWLSLVADFLKSSSSDTSHFDVGLILYFFAVQIQEQKFYDAHCKIPHGITQTRLWSSMMMQYIQTKQWRKSGVCINIIF